MGGQPSAAGRARGRSFALVRAPIQRFAVTLVVAAEVDFLGFEDEVAAFVAVHIPV